MARTSWIYEAKGLLPKAERSAAGYRLDSPDDVELLTFIRRARALGLQKSPPSGRSLSRLSAQSSVHRRADVVAERMGCTACHC